MTQAYPLQWPLQRPRTPHGRRRDGKFHRSVDTGRGWREKKDLTLPGAIDRLQGELDRIGARHVVLSTNLETRLDGLPRAGQRQPDDPGVAVYFDLKGKPHCLPCDTYTKIVANVAAVAAHIEATRAIERHGVASVAEMFSGFQALPAPGTIPWWQILQVPEAASRAEIDASYRRLARERHPDVRGGSEAMMADLNTARDAALRARP